MTTFTISVAFLMGLTGSLHCAGMCGPIVWVMRFGELGGVRRWLGIALYHLARISVYAAMALIVYSFRSLFQPQWQQYISILLGGGLLIAGLLSFMPLSKLKFSLPWAGIVHKNLSVAITRPGLAGLAIAGFLNGLLPCGLEYMVLASSVGASTPTEAAMLMYAFGMGTVPMMVGISILRNKAGFLRFQHARKLVPVVMMVFGGLFIVRGMNLGIPYLSPKITVEQQEIKAECCHKK